MPAFDCCCTRLRFSIPGTHRARFIRTGRFGSFTQSNILFTLSLGPSQFFTVLTARNPMHYETLEGLSETKVFGASVTLYSSYGIDDRDSALEILGQLAYAGHSGINAEGYDALHPYIRGEKALTTSERNSK